MEVQITKNRQYPKIKGSGV